MIRFTCEQCGQKIRVNDTAAGKNGRCPACKQPLKVPELALQDVFEPAPATVAAAAGQPVIDYECLMCRNVLKASKADQGSIKECPHCGSFAEVPVPEKPAAADGIQLQPKAKPADDFENPFTRQPPVPPAAAARPRRILPIFLDVFLFPLNKSGLMMLVAFTLAPIVLYPVAFLGVFGPLIYSGLMVCVWAYMFWYLTLCIHKSAEGEIRAPDTFGEDVNTSMGDMVLQLLRTILLIVVCLLPAFIFRVMTDTGAGTVFYGILVACIFFLPMMLLASVMFDSFWAAWNPRVILGGMFSSLAGYIGLVLAFYIPVGLYFYISQLARGNSQENMALALALNGCSIYMIMVSSHLLGWFFYKNEEKLYWAV